MNVDISKIQNFFFVGIAGTGMSAIAQYLNGIGNTVSGSDRLFAQDNKLPIQTAFEKTGIRCFFQDASGISANTGVVVISTAIEENNVEYQKAKELSIPIVKRSEILAAISDSMKTIAVGGTSGKSTTTAMIFHILQENNMSPSLITGAGLSQLQIDGMPGNAWVGESDILVIEADESDGSIVGYHPEIGIVLNIDRDHKEFDELIDLFTQFKSHTKSTFIVNEDQALTKKLSQNSEHNFGITSNAGFKGSNFHQDGFTIRFHCNDIPVSIPIIGIHNMENALAAIAASKTLGVSIEKSATALKKFRGIYRRTQVVGENKGVIVIDDFAHNPAEVCAAIKACQQISPRVHAWFQPHGYGPLRFMHQELIDKLGTVLRDSDTIYMTDVYYAGGTVSKDINSDSVIEALLDKNKKAIYVSDRNKIIPLLNLNTELGDIILLMGARDPSLEQFAKDVLENI